MVGLEDKYKRFPNELSGGEQQKVAIARALVGNPMLILADEPTGNLDPANSKMIMELLHEIHEKLCMTMLIATHDYEAIEHLSGSEFVLEEKGRIYV
jgi:cell division transport system ATP-binding protein